MNLKIEGSKELSEVFSKAASLTSKEKALLIILLNAEEKGINIDFAADCKKQISVKSAPIEYEKIVALYNENCKSLPKVTTISQTRKNAMRILNSEYSIEKIEEAFKKAQASEFLTGKNKPWRANFDWLIKKANFVKTLEGNYDNRKVESGEMSASYNLDLFERMLNEKMLDYSND